MSTPRASLRVATGVSSPEGLDQAVDGTTTPEQAALDAVDASIAVVDLRGRIIAINAAWTSFGRANGRADPGIDVGLAYPADTAPGLRDVIDGVLDQWTTTYPCHSPAEERWFRMLVVRLGAAQAGRVATKRLRDAGIEPRAGMGESRA